MEKRDIKFIQQLFKDHSRSMVGRLCKQNELLRKDDSLTAGQKLDILKSFNRELIYESFRDLSNHIKCYNLGLNYQKFEVYKPTE